MGPFTPPSWPSTSARPSPPRRRRRSAMPCTPVTTPAPGWRSRSRAATTSAPWPQSIWRPNPMAGSASSCWCHWGMPATGRAKRRRPSRRIATPSTLPAGWTTPPGSLARPSASTAWAGARATPSTSATWRRRREPYRTVPPPSGRGCWPLWPVTCTTPAGSRTRTGHWSWARRRWPPPGSSTTPTRWRSACSLSPHPLASGARRPPAARGRRDARCRAGAGDGEMVAEARLLRATALIELGEPEGIDELEA